MFEKLNPFSGHPSDVSQVVDLRIYPIKSCRGISVKKSYLTKRGLDLDRRWMFVDAETLRFITIRDISAMTLVDTAIATTSDESATSATKHDDEKEEATKGGVESLVISIRNTSTKIIIPTRPSSSWLSQNTTLQQVDIWDYQTDAYVYNDAFNSPFSAFFEKPVKLVYKGPTPRILRGNAAPEILGRQESTNFPDVMPLLLANEASLRELNARLKEKRHEEITIERFRPNIIVKGAISEDENGKGEREDQQEPANSAPIAWSEDYWKTVRILPARSQSQSQSTSSDQPNLVQNILGLSQGGQRAEHALEIDVQARCARCQVPNVNPDTAEKDSNEPWDTLMSYRRVDEGIKWKPCFGMLSVPRGEGEVSVGMRFEVVETTEAHKYVKGF